MSKLVRDKIPEIIRGTGETPVTRKVTGLEFRAALIEKLFEEFDEFVAAHTRDEILGELADIVEVAYAIADSYGGGLEDVRLVKLAERGGFNEGIIWEGNEP
jgi:predicted house-cleaning noncanonical NTP pyrophosphatase (MazG superfamily)